MTCCFHVSREWPMDFLSSSGSVSHENCCRMYRSSCFSSSCSPADAAISARYIHQDDRNTDCSVHPVLANHNQICGRLLMNTRSNVSHNQTHPTRYGNIVLRKQSLISDTNSSSLRWFHKSEPIFDSSIRVGD